MVDGCQRVKAAVHLPGPVSAKRVLNRLGHRRVTGYASASNLLGYAAADPDEDEIEQAQGHR